MEREIERERERERKREKGEGGCMGRGGESYIGLVWCIGV